MSDSSPGPVFPPFGPARPRPSASAPATPAAPPAFEPAPAFEAAAAFDSALPSEPPVFRTGAESEPDVDLPFMAPAGEEAMPWEMPSVAEPGPGTSSFADSATAPPPAAEADDEEPAAEDLPWLEMPPEASSAFAPDSAVEPRPEADVGEEGQDALASSDSAASAPADAGGGLPDTDWLAWEAPAAADADAEEEEPAEELSAVPTSFLAPAGFGASDAAPDPGVVPVGDMFSIPQSAGGMAASAAEPADSPASLEAAASTMAPGAVLDGGEYEEVAARLERIARSLRESPAAFLGGGSADALDLLVTGFVLGYTQRGR
ncbi:MAG: hypothetical protein JWM27_3320 [Gemmatimonadetes bacterium]|nr:hypothetical protein [Gemmatimonadota bacterium]